uniref:MULE transposase domain-containing protein n=1 Tax=Lactuca sativa TaxID=4236 RepID=A0A9R1XPJ5_LACSA|nr:hypothetical protein LSAT_V11C200054980 [Lactuca sativa]
MAHQHNLLSFRTVDLSFQAALLCWFHTINMILTYILNVIHYKIQNLRMNSSEFGVWHCEEEDCYVYSDNNPISEDPDFPLPDYMPDDIFQTMKAAEEANKMYSQISRKLKQRVNKLADQITTFLTSMIPTIFVTHVPLIGANITTMYIALALDGNHEPLIIAFTLVSTDYDEAWTWFMRSLKEC